LYGSTTHISATFRAYHERAVCLFNAKGVQVADTLVGLNSKTGELRVLVTARGEGDADHKHAV